MKDNFIIKNTSANTVTVIATEHDGLDERIISLLFEIPNKDFDIVAAVKAAAKDFCLTEEGKKVYEGNCNCFNWGDFDAYVPQNICKKHGFIKLEACVGDVIVDFDEQLVDENDIFPKEE